MCPTPTRPRFFYHSARFSLLSSQLSILDGEIVCLDQEVHSQFNKLMYCRREPRFYAFDLLWLMVSIFVPGPCWDRKAALRNIVPTKSERLLDVDHIEGCGEDLFRLTCKKDLEGVVAKWKRGAYVQGERTNWVKVKNRKYSQSVGREELFVVRDRDFTPSRIPGYSVRLRCPLGHQA